MPGPELRRLLLDDLPVDRAHRPARSRSSPAVCPRSDGLSTTSTARPTSGSRTQEPRATSSAIRTIAPGAREICARLEAEDVRLPGGDRLTARRFRQIGLLAGLHRHAGSPSTICSSCPSARTASCSTPQLGASNLRAQSRSTPRFTRRATPTAAPRAGPRRGCIRPSSTEQLLHRPSTSFRGCSRTTARCARIAAAAELLAQPRVAAAVRRGHPGAQRGAGRGHDLLQRSVRRAPSSRSRRPRRFAGLRPWVTNEYEHNAPWR